MPDEEEQLPVCKHIEERSEVGQAAPQPFWTRAAVIQAACAW